MKKHFIYFLLLASFSAMAQLKNFGSNALFKPEPNYYYGVYGYFDLIRESGVGFQFQVGNRWNLDASAYLVNKQYSLSGTISQWDYYDLTGYGFTFKPKYLISKMNRFYIGANLAIEALHHDKTWVEYTLGRGDRRYNLEETKGVAYTIGFTLGNRTTYKRLLIEPFFGMGYVISGLSSKSYASTTGGAIQYYTQPVFVSNHNYFQLNIGIKFGCSFKKNKANEVIDKKFDEVYIPKTDSLTNYFNAIGFEVIEKSANLKVAFENYKRLNRQILGTYQFHYDTSVFYLKVNNLYSIIYQKINTHYAIQKKQATIYAPKNEALQAYFNTIDFKNENTSKYLKKAYAKFNKTKALNLLKYNSLSTDTVKLYQVMDGHYHKIETLISKAKK